MWGEKLGMAVKTKPFWRVFYKPPLIKNTGDLQWRNLHAAVAVNAFISVINPSVNGQCVFCGLRETVFRCFLDCVRLKSLFVLLSQVFLKFGEKFTLNAFIFGTGYSQKQILTWQQISFVIGQAKLAIYISRKNTIENRPGQDIMPLFKAYVKSRIVVDFKYYKLINDLASFLMQWCYKNIFCAVMEGGLSFSLFFFFFALRCII